MSLERFIYSLGIRHVGQETAVDVAKHFHKLKNVLNAKAEEFYNKNVAGYIKEIKEDYADWKKDDMRKTEIHPEDGKSIKL